MAIVRKQLRIFVLAGAGCLLLYGLLILLAHVCGGHFRNPWDGLLWAFVVGGLGGLVAMSVYRSLVLEAEASISGPQDFLARASFWRVIYGDGERETPVDVRLYPDRLTMEWTGWLTHTHVEIPWGELAIVPAATLWLGDHPSWDQKGLAMRWTTPTERFRGWKRVWLPCQPGSDFYREVQRLIGSNHAKPT